jgi:hypothetical protein
LIKTDTHWAYEYRLLQDKELVNTHLIKIDTNVKEKYRLLQNKGYGNGYISGLKRENPQKIVLLFSFLAWPGHFFSKKRISINGASPTANNRIYPHHEIPGEQD